MGAHRGRRGGRILRAALDRGQGSDRGAATSAGSGRRLDAVQAAFFDLDKTVIARAALVALTPSLRRAGYLSRWLVLRALWGHLVFHYLGADERRMERMRASALRIAVGWDQAHVSRLVEEALDEVVVPIVYAEALELIAEHRRAGRRIYLVS